MTNASYSHALRILACAQCGAPLEVALEGGTFACGYCGAANQLARRDEREDRARAAAAASATISESERLARLREQQLGEWLPPSVERLVENGKLSPGRLDEAKSEWSAARTALRSAPAFPLSERFFYLTVLLVPVVEKRAQRAILETAIELLPDEGHRHILRCMMARLAVGAGDLKAATAWMAPCNPRPLDLPMDSAYRYAAATIAAASGRDAEVLGLLGTSAGDVPLAERDALGCALLRVHALERGGRADDAVRALLELRESMGPLALVEAVAAQPIPHCCGRSLAAVATKHRRERISTLRFRHRQLKVQLGVRRLLLHVALYSAIIAAPVALLAFGIKASQPYSSNARLWCPLVCGDCRAPMQQYYDVFFCSDRTGPLRWTSAELAAARRAGDPWVIRHSTTEGALLAKSFVVIASISLLGAVPLFGIPITLLGARSARRRQRRIEDELAQLESLVGPTARDGG